MFHPKINKQKKNRWEDWHGKVTPARPVCENQPGERENQVQF